ncbi:ABC transporter permease [Bifidobacterium sp. ESL0784]|uniref:ABC transporter permease n=1 Tax=Bifidobacterium sp. ESL0784 TaxID=2983231 RepID=UPI0023F9FAFC|nr:ABC transporter permease [Bifidobacterium sp. ESL0784]MDF7641111.1 ABC transporter permease [Bifidobacterium sp. ESL0784]
MNNLQRQSNYRIDVRQVQDAMSPSRLPFTRILKSENLKSRRSPCLKLALIMPLPLVFLGLLMAVSTPKALMATYAWNYWVFLLCPIMLVLVCSTTANLDRKQRLRTVLALPINPARIWLAKCCRVVMLLVLSNLVVWVLTTVFGSAYGLQVPKPLQGLAAVFCSTVMLSCMIPVSLWLTTSLGNLAGIAIPFLIELVGSVLAGGISVWWLVPPCGIMRVIAPLIGVLPDGSPITAGDPLNSFGLFNWLALLMALLIVAVLIALTAGWFSRRETK